MFDSLMKRAGGLGNVSPMQIAQHTLLTEREKVELLGLLKSKMAERGDEAEFSGEEIDMAIQAVRASSQDDVGRDTVLG